MKLCYFILIIFIAKIYSVNLPLTCQTTETPPAERNCVQTDCDNDSNGRTQLYDNKCYTPVTDCATYSTTADECSTCTGTDTLELYPPANDNTSPLTKKCYTKVPNCDEYNPYVDACYKCKTHYKFNSDHRECVPENCQTQDTNDKTKCATCNPGFSGSNSVECTCTGGTIEDGICKNLGNCLVYGSDAKCTKCKPGYKVDSGACSTCSGKYSDGVTCSETVIMQSGCAEYESNGSCKKCTFNEVTKEYLKTTVSGDNTVVACVPCGSDTKVGYECKTDASADHTSEINGCVYYTDATHCGKCQNTYLYLDNNECKPCYAPQGSDGVHCYDPTKASAAGCSSYDYIEDKCTACNNGYTLQSDGTCAYQTCTKCGGGDDGGNGGNGGDDKGNGEASNSSAMKLNIIFMAIMLMIVA